MIHAPDYGQHVQIENDYRSLGDHAGATPSHGRARP